MAENEQTQQYIVPEPVLVPYVNAETIVLAEAIARLYEELQVLKGERS